MCVLFYSSFVCIFAYANVYFKTTIIKQNIKIILIAGVPWSQALPGYLITAPPSECVPAVIGVLAVWIQHGIAASVAGRVGGLAAVCRERVVVGVAGRRSSAGGAASCQVMSPGLSSVVSSTLVEGAPDATHLTRPALVSSQLHFHSPAH